MLVYTSTASPILKRGIWNAEMMTILFMNIRYVNFKQIRLTIPNLGKISENTIIITISKSSNLALVCEWNN